MKFRTGDLVQCAWGELRYEARVVRVDGANKANTPYLIHYQGWNDRWDEWVGEQRLRALPNAANKRRRSESPAKSAAQKSKPKPLSRAELTLETVRPRLRRKIEDRQVIYSSADGRRFFDADEIRIFCDEENFHFSADDYDFVSGLPPPKVAKQSSRTSAGKSTKKAAAGKNKSAISGVAADHESAIDADLREIQRSIHSPPPKTARGKKRASLMDAQGYAAGFPGESSSSAAAGVLVEEIDLGARREADMAAALLEAAYAHQGGDYGDAAVPVARGRRQPAAAGGRAKAAPRSAARQPRRRKVEVQRLSDDPSRVLMAAAYEPLAAAAGGGEADYAETEFIEIQAPDPPPILLPTSSSASKRQTSGKGRAPAKKKQARGRSGGAAAAAAAGKRSPTQLLTDSAPDYAYAMEPPPPGHHDQHEQQQPRMDDDEMADEYGVVLDRHHGRRALSLDDFDGQPPPQYAAPVEGITVTGTAPVEPPSRVFMKLKPPESKKALRFKQSIRVMADGTQYIDPHYSPNLHVGGRGRFGVVGTGPPPPPPIVERSDDFVYIPPDIAADHCYGKTAPPPGGVSITTHDGAGFGRGRVLPAHLLPTFVGQGSSRAVLRQQHQLLLGHGGGGRMLATLADSHSPSPPVYAVAGGAGGHHFAMSIDEHDIGDLGGMEVVSFEPDDQQDLGAEVAMSLSSSSSHEQPRMLSVDKLPANILEGVDDEATSIDIR